MLVHFDVGKRTMVSLVNYGEKDPIVEFAKQLASSGDKENWKMSKKLEPKMRIFAPVIVRGEEEKGVRLWEFGKQVYTELLSLADDPDVGDYTDVVQGRDITIETTSPETNGTGYNQTKVRVRTKTTPLSENSQEVERWLNNQPDILSTVPGNSYYIKYSYDNMKEALLSWLNPEEEAEEAPAEVSAPKQEEVPASKPTTFSLNTKPKPSIDDEFDELFSSKTNDLPF